MVEKSIKKKRSKKTVEKNHISFFSRIQLLIPSFSIEMQKEIEKIKIKLKHIPEVEIHVF